MIYGIFVRNLSPPCWKDAYMMDYPGYPLVKVGARFCRASSLEVYQPHSRPPAVLTVGFGVSKKVGAGAGLR